MLSDNSACAGRFVPEEYKTNPHDDNNISHDDNLSLQNVANLKTGLNCLHNFNNEKQHYIKSGVEKDVLHLVEDLDRVMAKYEATYQIGTKSTTSEARKRKEHRKKGKRDSMQLVKTEEKEHAFIFCSLLGAILS